VVLFPGNKFTGEIAPGLVALERSGIIRVRDFVLVSKDGDGIVGTKGAECLDIDHRKMLVEPQRPEAWLSLEDVAIIGAMIPRDGSAAAVLIENTWRSMLGEGEGRGQAATLDDGCVSRKQVVQTLR
jgi:hypothetical protein